jgi:hypothetical protein
MMRHRAHGPSGSRTVKPVSLPHPGSKILAPRSARCRSRQDHPKLARRKNRLPHRGHPSACRKSGAEVFEFPLSVHA